MEGFLRERVVVSALSGKTLLAGAKDLYQVMRYARANDLPVEFPIVSVGDFKNRLFSPRSRVEKMAFLSTVLARF